jgi:hypothetical protein
MTHDVIDPNLVHNSQPVLEPEPVLEQVIADVRERDPTVVHVQAFDLRKPLVDAYHEVLDLAVYMRQLIIEQESRSSKDERDSLVTQVALLREQLDRALELRLQAEAMCAERTRERDAMERRALAAEAELARLRFDQAERPDVRGRFDPSCCSPGPCEHDDEVELNA